MQQFDIVVVGAGPAGLLAARAAAETGLEVAVLERKTEITKLNRTCAMTFISMNEYFFDDLCIYNRRDKRIAFPRTGFSFRYDGPTKNMYSTHFYTPAGHLIENGDLETQRALGDNGAVALGYDKEILLGNLLEDAVECGVKVFPGVGVDTVSSFDGGVDVGGGGQTFRGRYVIAADGVNSSVARLAGFNDDRTYYGTLRALTWYMTGVKMPNTDCVANMHGFPGPGAGMFFVVPTVHEGVTLLALLTMDPRIDMEAAIKYFMAKPFLKDWFTEAKWQRSMGAACNCYSPIEDIYKDNILVCGDVPSTQELECTAAMISGWRSGCAAAAAVREESVGETPVAMQAHVDWWQAIYPDARAQIYMKIYAPPYYFPSEDDLNFVFGSIESPLKACWNPYTSGMPKALKKVIPQLLEERPEFAAKLARTKLSNAEIFADIAAMSKPVV